MPGFLAFKGYAPGSPLENAKLPVPFERIEKRSHISSRRLAFSQETITSMGVEVVNRLRQILHLPARDSGGLVLSSCSPNVPRHAQSIAKLINLPDDAEVVGINAACCGFLAATQRAASIVEATRRPVFVIASELLHELVDYSDESTAFLFGDFAAGSMIADQGRHEILNVLYRSVDDPKHLLGMESVPNALDVHGRVARRQCIRMPGGRDLYRDAHKIMLRMVNEGIERWNTEHANAPLDSNDIAALVPHQGNGTITHNLEKLLLSSAWSQSPPLVMNRIHHMGNVGSAGIPAVLAAMEEEDPLWPGALVACPGLGAGEDMADGQLTEGNLLIRWDADRI